MARIPTTADEPPNAPSTVALAPANARKRHDDIVYCEYEVDDGQRARAGVPCRRVRTVVDEEGGHESAGRERDVEADEHVGEARREDGLPEVLRPATPDGLPGLADRRAPPMSSGPFERGRTSTSSRAVEDAVGEPIHGAA